MNNGLAAWLAAMIGISSAAAPPAEQAAPAASLSVEAPAAPVAYEAVEVTAKGTVTGSVTTTTPASTGTLPVTQDNPVCGEAVADQTVVVADGKLANAVVWIDGLQSGAAPTPVEATLDQQGCVYLPHVQAVPQNSDAVLHNTHSYLDGSRTLFNLAMPEQDQRITRDLRRSGLVDVKCDAGHTWMSAYIWVFDHPYFAVTGADGSFTLADVPAGTHTLKVWHEKLGTTEQSITVEADGTATLSLSL